MDVPKSILLCMCFVASTFPTALGTDFTPIPDFENDYNGYDFIYHHNHNLLLVMQGDNCYFVNTPMTKQEVVDSDTSVYSISRLNVTQTSLIEHIERNDSGIVWSSSLDEVREVYHDILADFHCANKHIYQMSLYSGLQNSTDHACDPYPAKALYLPDPSGGCDSYVVCWFGITYVRKCPANTAFSSKYNGCTWKQLVAGCEE